MLRLDLRLRLGSVRIRPRLPMKILLQAHIKFDTENLNLLYAGYIFTGLNRKIT